jgi:hypothetical protein
VALITLVPFGNVTLADAVELASVPPSPLLSVVVGAAPSLFTVTAMLVPRGTLEAARSTVTGLATVGLNVISGWARNEPCGFAGGATPATAVILRVGVLAGGVTGPGNPEDGGGFMPPVAAISKASRRMRPKPPAPTAPAPVVRIE